MTEDVQELMAEQPSPAPRRRGLRILVWVAAVVLGLGAAGGGLVIAQRDHLFDAARQTTLHQLNILGVPLGFHRVSALSSDPGPGGWDSGLRLGRRYFDGMLEPRDLTKALDFWLAAGGVFKSAGPPESQSCSRVLINGTAHFGCGNFFRETPSWRIWIQVSGNGWPGTRVPAMTQLTPVHLEVVVQPIRSLAESLVPDPVVTSPGLASGAAAGSVRTVLTLSAAQAKTVDLDDASFGPAGQLVTTTTGLPIVIPVTAGLPARQLVFSSWPSVPREFVPVTANATAADAALMGPDGALWLHLNGSGLRRLSPDGRPSNIFGINTTDGNVGDGPAVGQDPYQAGQQIAVSADGTSWVAAGQLLRIRDGKLAVLDPSLGGVDSVVSDGHNGVYFGTGSRIFHLTDAGYREELDDPGEFSDVSSLALAKDGSLFVIDGAQLKRLAQDGSFTVVAGSGDAVAGRDDPVFCARPVPRSTATLPVSAAYTVIASPLGGVYLTGCNRLVQVGY